MDSANSATQNVEELQKAIAILQATLEATTDGILVVDKDGKTVNLNNKFKQLWGIPDEVLATRNDEKAIEFVLQQLTNPDAFLAKVKELYASTDEESFDTLNFKDGKIFERYSKPLKVSGEYVGRVWSFRDVTQQRIDQKILENRTAELEKMNQSMVNRELKMVELKKENEELKKRT